MAVFKQNYYWAERDNRRHAAEARARERQERRQARSAQRKAERAAREAEQMATMQSAPDDGPRSK